MIRFSRTVKTYHVHFAQKCTAFLCSVIIAISQQAFRKFDGDNDVGNEVPEGG